MNKNEHDVIIKDTIYETVIANGVPESDIDNHYSDLYLRVTVRMVGILKAYYSSKGLPDYKPNTFRSNIENDGIWYEIPFEYLPYWNDKAEGKPGV